MGTCPRYCSFTAISTRTSALLSRELRTINGQPALVLRRDGSTFGVLLLGVADGRVHRVYFHADPARHGGLVGES